MSSSRSSSSSRRAAALAALATLAGGCAAHRTSRRAPAAAFRLAVLPIDNLSAAGAPLKRISSALEQALARRGIEVVCGDAIATFLRDHRIRSVSGIDAASARAARDERGVDGVLVTTLETWATQPFPRLGLAMRVVAASEEPEVLWVDGTTLAGDDSPGLFGLGFVRSMDRIERRVLDRLSGSLRAWLDGDAPRASACPSDRRFAPKVAYRAPQLANDRRYTVAVLPFVNESDRRHGGEIVALEFLRQLHAQERFTVVEPGEIREQILRYRLIMEGGVSLDYAMLLLRVLRADVIVAGTVREYQDGDPPRVSFTALALERETERIAWEATSFGNGNDGVFFFDAGYVNTAADLACRMARRSTEQMSEGVRRPVAAPERPARAGETTAKAGERPPTS